MADFRKLFFAFALVALMLLGAGTASAQQQPVIEQSLTCVANASTPVIDRVEGIIVALSELTLHHSHQDTKVAQILASADEYGSARPNSNRSPSFVNIELMAARGGDGDRDSV